MTYRDTRGRFRTPTDKERWPDDRLRRVGQRLRALAEECRREEERRLLEFQWWEGVDWSESQRLALTMQAEGMK